MAVIRGAGAGGARVSVVVPCRDAGPHLEQALRSALGQRCGPFEVIVVDDGSADDSLEVALGVRALAPEQVRVLAEVSNSAARTRNIGASVATGDALLFLDADDVLGPGAIGALLDVLPPGGLSVCPWSRLEHDGRAWTVAPATSRRKRPGQEPLSAWLGGWWHPPCSVLWTREAFERAGRWDELCTVDDDGDLVMRALAAGLPLGESLAGRSYYRRALPATASLSGAQRSATGLRSRLRVVQKVEAALVEQGRLDDHRLELRRRLSGIIRDAEAGGHLEVAAEALEDRARLGSPAVAAREVAARARRHVTWSLDRRRGGAPAPERAAGEALVPADAAGRPRLAGARSACGPSRPRRPAVSVVLPTYQRAHAVSRAIDSVLSQSFTDLELIVVDDASTDGTAEVLAAYDDPRLRVLRQPGNRGVSAARNRAMRAARADLVAFIDSDDAWLPGKLEEQVRRMGELPATVGILYGGVEDVGRGDGSRVRTPSWRGDLRAVLARRNVIHGTSGVVMRRAVIGAIGFFDEDIPAIEDWDYWFRAARFFTFEHLARPLIRYDDAQQPDRKTLQRDQNHRARDHFHAKHRMALRALGAEHLFLVDSARRRLLQSGDVAGARRVARRAVAAAPFDPSVLRMLLRTHLLAGPAGGRRTERRSAGDAPAAIPVLLHCAVDMSESGGVQTVFRRLRQGLAERGYCVAQSWNRRTGSCPQDEAAVTVVRLALPGRGGVVATARSLGAAARALVTLGALVRRTRPALVNVHFAHPGLSHFLWLRRLFHFRLVVSVHGSDVLKVADPAALARLERQLAAADAITAVSVELTQRVRAMASIDPERVLHIPNGIDVDFWSEALDHPHEHRPPTIVNVGRLRPDHKAQDVLLRAFVEVAAAVPGARLVLVGEGPAEAELRGLAEELGVSADVDFAGAVPPGELRSLLGRAAVFVLASRREGLPVSLLEAMAAGVPPVVTSVGSMAEVVADDGLVVPPDDPGALASTIVGLLLDRGRAREVGAQARTRAAAFSADSVDERYDRLFRELVLGGPRGGA